jgi:hypothetical protein
MSVSDQPATKQDLAAAVAPLATKKDLAEFEQRISEELAEAGKRIIENLTEAIRGAFYKSARPIEVRTGLAWVEERLAALERGKFPSAG